MQEGWVCPKCGRVFAPWVGSCGYCQPGYITQPYTNPSTTGDPVPNPFIVTCHAEAMEEVS
jgi:predicted ATP-dependent serine protease